MERTLELLRIYDLFRHLSWREQRALEELALVKEYKAGEIIVYQGETIASLLIIRRGSIVAIGSGRGQEERIYLTREGIGRKALVTPYPAKMRYVAIERSIVVEISHEHFRLFLTRFPGALGRLRPYQDEQGCHVAGYETALWRELRRLFPWREEQEVLHEVRESLLRPLYHLIPVLLGGGLLLISWKSGFLSSFAERFLLPGLLGLSLAIAGARCMQWWFDVVVLGEGLLNYRTLTFWPLRLRRERIPLGEIQAVEARKKGWVGKLVNVGSLTICTSTVEGSLTLATVSSPFRVQKTLQEILQKKRTLGEGEGRREWQREVADRLSGRCVPTLPSQEVPQGVHHYRKSGPYLLVCLFPPLLFLGGGVGMSVYWFSMPFPLAMSVALLLLVAVSGRRIMRWCSDRFSIEGGQAIEIRKNLLTREETRKELEIASILRVRVEKKGMLPFLLNCGDVVMESSGGGRMRFEDLPHPHEVQADIFRLKEAWARKQEQKRRRARQDELLVLVDMLAQKGSLPAKLG